MKQVVDNFSRFHPHPEQIILSNPEEEPEFIKPYFGLRLFPCWHIGTDYLHEIGKSWYDYLCITVRATTVRILTPTSRS